MSPRAASGMESDQNGVQSEVPDSSTSTSTTHADATTAGAIPFCMVLEFSVSLPIRIVGSVVVCIWVCACATSDSFQANLLAAARAFCCSTASVQQPLHIVWCRCFCCSRLCLLLFFVVLPLHPLLVLVTVLVVS